MLTYEKIKKVNEKMGVVDIKGKDYVEVNTRVTAFRELIPNGTIETEIISLDNGVITIKAVIRDETGKILSTGFAQEKENSTFINKTSFVENAETSAVGRALGFLGLGINGSIASSEEVLNAINNQNKTKTKKETKTQTKKEVVEKENKNEITQQQLLTMIAKIVKKTDKFKDLDIEKIKETTIEIFKESVKSEKLECKQLYTTDEAIKISKSADKFIKSVE